MTDDSTHEQNQETLASELPRPGQLVREKRESAGLSFNEVAEALHMTVHYVKALENDEYEKLPGLTFVKGYFRSYARYLKIDDAEVLECYEAFLKAQNLGNEQEESYRISRRTDQVIMWAVIAAIILVLGLALGWWFVGRENTPQRVQAESTDLRLPAQQTAPENSATAMVVASSVEAEAESPQQDMPADAQDEAETADLMAENVPATAQEITAEDLMAETQAAEAAAPAPALPAQSDTAEALTADSQEAIPASAENAGETEEAQSGQSDTELNDTAADNAGSEEADADPLAITIAEDGARNISLLGEGDDLLQLNFSGNSWVEVGDAVNPLLYNDLLGAGDQLNIQSRSPFYVLLGDATQVEVLLNERPVNISSRIRSTNSARFMLSAQGAQRWVVEQ